MTGTDLHYPVGMGLMHPDHFPPDRLVNDSAVFRYGIGVISDVISQVEGSVCSGGVPPDPVGKNRLRATNAKHRGLPHEVGYIQTRILIVVLEHSRHG